MIESIRTKLTALLRALATPIGASGELTVQAQRLLNKLNYSAGPVDGLYSRKTERALIKFFKYKGDTFDGELSKNEIKALKNAVKLKNKIAGQHIFPKYFYTQKLNQRCKIKEKSNFYFSPIEDGYDLNNLFLYEWLLKLKDMSWKSYHNETSNSLTVDHGVYQANDATTNDCHRKSYLR